MDFGVGDDMEERNGKLCKYRIYVWKRKNNPFKNWDMEGNRVLSSWNTNVWEAVFKCSISLEMQIKTTLQFILASSQWLRFPKKQKGERVALIFEGM